MSIVASSNMCPHCGRSDELPATPPHSRPPPEPACTCQYPCPGCPVHAPAVEYHAVGGNPPPEVLEVMRAAYPAVARGEQTAEELRARIVQQGRNRVRVYGALLLDGAALKSFVDWIETMDRDATVPMEARPLTERERTAELERADVVAEFRRRSELARQRAETLRAEIARKVISGTSYDRLNIAESDIERWDHEAAFFERGLHVGASPRKAGE